MSDRDEFEAWIESMGWDVELGSHSEMWMGWQAARRWRPISEAPKDAREILAWSDVTNEYFLAWWSAGAGDWAWAHVDEGVMYCDPTHWMPLPEPPELTPEQAADELTRLGQEMGDYD